MKRKNNLRVVPTDKATAMGKQNANKRPLTYLNKAKRITKRLRKNHAENLIDIGKVN